FLCCLTEILLAQIREFEPKLVTEFNQGFVLILSHHYLLPEAIDGQIHPFPPPRPRSIGEVCSTQLTNEQSLFEVVLPRNQSHWSSAGQFPKNSHRFTSAINRSIISSGISGVGQRHATGTRSGPLACGMPSLL